jgi:hypothetical protein
VYNERIRTAKMEMSVHSSRLTNHARWSRRRTGIESAAADAGR